jgi:L-rhamnose isomerase
MHHGEGPGKPLGKLEHLAVLERGTDACPSISFHIPDSQNSPLPILMELTQGVKG